MKNNVLITIVFLLPTLFTNAQDKLTGEQQSVQKVVVDLFHALSDRDQVKLKDNCTEDIIILENGEVWNLDTLIQAVSQNTAPDFKRINSFEFIETKVNGKLAWTSYYNEAEGTRNGKAFKVKWLETAILIKRNGHWKVKTLHSTLIRRS